MSVANNKDKAVNLEDLQVIYNDLRSRMENKFAEAGTTIVENIASTTPSIIGLPNARYVCQNALSELSITPPSSGSIEVIFTAGSNCIVTVPQTVRWPAWFDITDIVAGTTYDIIITDGVYGAVMTWAAS